MDVQPIDGFDEDAEAPESVEVYAPSFRRVPAIKCSAKSSRTGQPCGKWAVRGSNVCGTHGGSAPQVRAAARRRLQALAPFATSVLAELASGVAVDPSTGVPVAVPPGVRQRAAAELLKMSGAGAPQELDLAVSEGAPRPDLDTVLDAAITQALASRGIEVPGAGS